MTELYNKFFALCIRGEEDTTEYAKKLFTSGITYDFFLEYEPSTRRFKATPYSLIYQIVYDYYEQFNTLITQDILATEIKKEKFTQAKLGQHLTCIEDILDTLVDVSETAYLIESVEEEYLKSKLANVAVQLVAQAEVSPKEALAQAHQDVTNLLFMTREKDEQVGPQSLTEFISYQLNKYKDSKEFVQPSAVYGFSKMDYRLGGLFPGELTLISAPPSAGKSFIVQQIVYSNSILADTRGVYATNEITVDQFWIRLCSSQTGIAINKFLRNALTEEEQDLFIATMENLREANKDNLLILGPGECSSVRDLRSAVQSYFGNKTPGYTCVDHLTNFAAQGSGSEAEQVLRNARELRGFAGGYNTSVISPTHLNRAGNNSTGFSMNNTQYVALNQIADNIIMVREDPDDPILPPEDGEDYGRPGTLEAVIVRSRTGATGSRFFLKADFSRASVTEAKTIEGGSYKSSYDEVTEDYE